MSDRRTCGDCVRFPSCSAIDTQPSDPPCDYFASVRFDGCRSFAAVELGRVRDAQSSDVAVSRVPDEHAICRPNPPC